MYYIFTILSDDSAGIFAASLLISFSSFSSIILSSFFMAGFNILSKGFFLKPKGLSDARVVSITQLLKMNIVFHYIFCKDS